MKDKLQAAITRDDLDEVKRIIAETEGSGVTNRGSVRIFYFGM